MYPSKLVECICYPAFVLQFFTYLQALSIHLLRFLIPSLVLMYPSKLVECICYPAFVLQFFTYLQTLLIHRNSLLVPALRLVYHSQMVQRSSLHSTCCSLCGLLIQSPHKVNKAPSVERLKKTLHQLTCCVVFACRVEKPARFQDMSKISFLLPRTQTHLRSSDLSLSQARSAVHLLVQVRRKGAGVGVHLVQIR